MRIAVPKERRAQETRVAASPESVKRLLALGCEVVVESGAGTTAGVADADYEAVGASIAKDAKSALKGAAIVLKVQRPLVGGRGDELKLLDKGAILVSILDPMRAPDDAAALAKAGVTAFAMDMVPRITRAQSMDVLSSQANLAGYKAVIDGAATFGRAFPMMMTAAGTVQPAKVFVMGAGVAGLQAIATARRLGAVVLATDVRPAAKQEVESLGAKFVAVEDEEFQQAQTAGGYAKQMSAEYQKKQAALVAETIAKQDIVITTALIPGRPAPRLVSAEMVRSMRPGSVVVDLAVETGGNCELAKPGEVVEVDGVTIVGHLNMPGRLAGDASQLYARNLYNFVELLVDRETKSLSVDLEDEIVKGTLVAHEGALVNEAVAEAAEVAASTAPAKAKRAPRKATAKPKAEGAAAAPAEGGAAAEGAATGDDAGGEPDKSESGGEA